MGSDIDSVITKFDWRAGPPGADERINRCGHKGQLEHSQYRAIRLEKADVPSGKDFTWYDDTKEGFRTPEGQVARYR